MSNAQRWQWLIIAAAIGWLVWRLSPILMPFMLAAVFAYLGDPLVDRLERPRIGRGLAASMVFLIVLLIVVLALVVLVPVYVIAKNRADNAFLDASLAAQPDGEGRA